MTDTNTLDEITLKPVLTGAEWHSANIKRINKLRVESLVRGIPLDSEEELDFCTSKEYVYHHRARRTTLTFRGRYKQKALYWNAKAAEIEMNGNHTIRIEEYTANDIEYYI